MAIRTTSPDVQGILGDHYDGTTDLSPFITTASSLVDRLATLDTDSILSTAQKELIERWLAAHFYVQADPILASKSTGKSSGVFEGQTAMALDNSRYGQMAKVLDVTGRLGNLSRPKARMQWLGKARSDQIAYEDRD